MKISSQSLLLKYFNLNNKKVDQYISEIDINDETNREAASAKSYFENMFGKRFDRRDEKQQYNITINSLLNYGYIVFTSLVARSIAKNGLDNRIGLFHKSFNNHFALACDLVEPFRVIVDCFTYKTVLLLKNKKNILDTEVKHKIIELIQRDIKIGGEKMSISLAVDKFVQSIINDKLITNIEYCFDEY
jgi:CRISPR-associated protein Cas1